MIRRNQIAGVWTYTDPAEHDAAFHFAEAFGFDLAGFDDWLEGPGWTPKAKSQAVTMRQRAVDAHHSGDWEAAQAWVTSLALLQILNQRDDLLVPLAQMGERYGDVQRKRRRDKPATDSYAGVNRNKRMRAYHARLVAGGFDDATAQTATEFHLSARQVRRIVNLQDNEG